MLPFLWLVNACPWCRVTPENGPPEEANNPTKAWRALLERHGLAKRAAGLSGLRMFGLDTPTVAKLIQSLPYAARCASFEAWAIDKPEAIPLVSILGKSTQRDRETLTTCDMGLQPQRLVFCPTHLAPMACDAALSAGLQVDSA